MQVQLSPSLDLPLNLQLESRFVLVPTDNPASSDILAATLLPFDADMVFTKQLQLCAGL